MKVKGLKSTRRTARTKRPELVLCSGPLVLGQPGAGTFGELYGASWGLALTRDGPRLYQRDGDGWADRDDPGALAALSPYTSRHVALAFDQSARPVLAWEFDGAVYVRQFDGFTGEYLTRGPWAGCDPLLLTDAAAMYRPAESDVLLVHLDPDRAAVLGRVQREVYNTAHPLGAVPAGTVLDQLTVHPYRWQLLGEAPDGAQLVRLSELYPIEEGERAALPAALVGGEVIITTFPRETAHTGTLTAALVAGELVASVYPFTLGDVGSVSGALIAGDFQTTSFPRTSAHTSTLTAAPAGGAFDTTTITRTAAHSAAVSAGIAGGTYG